MKNVYIVFLFVLFTSFALTDSPVKYSQIKIYVPDVATLQRVYSSGIDYEGSSGKIGGWMQFVAGKSELQRLAQNNIGYSVVIDDLTKEAQKHLSRTPFNALGFGNGSMGGHYTFAEVLQQLDSMKHRYPALITARESIGYTDEGRGLWAAKISSNPNVNDPAKPEVLYTGIHHAREPEGMMVSIYYMWWLLEHYGTDPDATYLVNNRQIWFIPVVNPDGYVYNQTIAPGGGGLWRKNRHNNGDGTYGVDLNRNYGNYTMWNSSNGGSDPYTYSETYRGNSPFSESETQTIKFFCEDHNFKTCLNYHTFGNDVIYPWGYLPTETNDSLTFREFAFDITGYNRYVNGVDMQTVHYGTRGNSDDYMYGDDTKPRTFAMTPEVGTATSSSSTSFWAATDSILPYAIENLEPNKYYSFVAGQYTVTKSCDLTDTDHDGGIGLGEHFSLTVTFENKGLGDMSHLHAAVSATNPDILWNIAVDSLDLISARGSAQLTFTGARTSSSISTSNQFIITITDPNGFLHRDTILSPLGSAMTLFADSANAGTANWNIGSGWGTTTTAHTLPYSFTDSPGGDYSNNSNNAFTLLHPIDLSGYPHSLLKFWTKWAIEPIFDFCFIEVSSDSGTTWTGLKSALSHRGSGEGMQTNGTWGYDGYNPGMDWVEQQIDLSSYAGSKVLLRFRLATDDGNTRDGIYLDDIRVIGLKDTASVSSYVLAVQQKWNLFSLPVQVDVATKGVVFPDAAAGAYGYEGASGYQLRDTVVMGKGYWVKFNSPEVLTIPGFLMNLATIDVVAGWNLIGSISSPVPVSTIGSRPVGLAFSTIFQYIDGRYAPADTIQPGKGYWVKADQPGSLILSASPSATAGNRARMIATNELPPPPPSVASAVKELPKEFRLEQNYPNPFNPSTTINYALPSAVHVTLKVYNTLGQEIATLVDGVQEAGYRSVRFEMNSAAGGIPSGIYMYRLSAGTFTDVKKMVVIK
jgi:hypothetical protein